MALLSTSLLTRRLLVPASHGAARRRAISASVAEAPAAAASTEGEQKPAQKKRVLSGVQPTGSLHLGNYLGAIRQWVANQDEYDNYFCVVDLHAITAPHTPKELTKSTYQTAALYLAAGLDPAKSKIFVQSHVRQHAELAWLLNCATPMGWLERMIQYKEKAAKQEGEGASVGLRQIEELPCRPEHRLVEVGVDAVAAEIDETHLVGCPAEFLNDSEPFGAGRIAAEGREVDDRQRIHGPILWFGMHPW